MGFALAFRETVDTPYGSLDALVAQRVTGEDFGGEPDLDRLPEIEHPSASSAPAAEPVPNAPAESPDIDAIEELGDEIATLAAHIHAATHRLLTLIARFDRVRGQQRIAQREQQPGSDERQRSPRACAASASQGSA